MENKIEEGCLAFVGGGRFPVNSGLIVTVGALFLPFERRDFSNNEGRIWHVDKKVMWKKVIFKRSGRHVIEDIYMKSAPEDILTRIDDYEPDEDDLEYEIKASQGAMIHVR